MSKVKRTMELSPPKGKMAKELLTSPGHACKFCNGAGYFDRAWWEQDKAPIPCPVCGGAGQVDAIITVEWKPSKKK